LASTYLLVTILYLDKCPSIWTETNEWNAMTHTVSVTEARDNFPALVRQVAEQDEPVVITNRNQPRVVMLRWETYQQQ
jgi:prevent-host-death family protein